MDKDVEAGAGMPLPESTKLRRSPDSRGDQPIKPEDNPSSTTAASEENEDIPSAESLRYLKTWLAYTLFMSIPKKFGDPQAWFVESVPGWFSTVLAEATELSEALKEDVQHRSMRVGLSKWLLKEHQAVQKKPLFFFPHGSNIKNNVDFAQAISKHGSFDKIYFCQLSKCLAMKTSSLLTESGKLTDAGRLAESGGLPGSGRLEESNRLASDAQILLVPCLTQATLHVLITTYNIHLKVLYKHTQKLQGAWRFMALDRYRDVKSPPLFDMSTSVSLYLEGDIFCTLSSVGEVDQTPLTYEMWPGVFGSTGKMSEIYLRTGSPVTIHAFRDFNGHSKVLVLFGRWATLLMDDTRLDKFWTSKDTPYPPFGYGEAEAFMDGEPMLKSGKLNESDYIAFCQEMSDSLSLWGIDANTDPMILLQAALRHTWPRVATIMSTIISRDRIRLQIFNECCFLPGRDPTRSELNEQVDALEFFDRHILYQLDTLVTLRDNLSIPAFGVQDHAWQTIKIQLADLHQQLKELQERSSYLMTRILRREQRQLTYSQLDEASLVRKLTIVALFFIPVSAVTSAYGMNLQEIQSHAPSAGAFVISLVVVTGFTFTAAAFDAIRDVDTGIIKRLQTPLGYLYDPDFLKYSDSDTQSKAIASVIRDLEKHGLRGRIPCYKLAGRIVRNRFPTLNKFLMDMTFQRKLILYQYVLTGIPRLVGFLIMRFTSTLKLYHQKGRREREARERKDD